jgi:hemoglobin-like flavoprotein
LIEFAHGRYPMTRSEIELVRNGFARLASWLEPACRAFCVRLFELDLSLRSLFPNDLDPLAACLATGLETVIRSLDDLRPVLSRAPALGLRLTSYGLEPMDLPTIGTAFLATLDSELGDELTDEARAAWLRVFWTIAIATVGADSPALAVSGSVRYRPPLSSESAASTSARADWIRSSASSSANGSVASIAA